VSVTAFGSAAAGAAASSAVFLFLAMVAVVNSAVGFDKKAGPDVEEKMSSIAGRALAAAGLLAF
jgi:hypothetical protein